MKQILGLFALLLLIVGGILLVQNYLKTNTFFPVTKKTSLTINNHVIKLTVARTPKEREIGLSETKSISNDEGMIFMFENPGYYSFWMKNMKFPIDIIYINDEEIVYIEKNAQIPTREENPTIYTPTELADKVLEIQSGLSDKYNFKKGDKIKYDNLSN